MKQKDKKMRKTYFKILFFGLVILTLPVSNAYAACTNPAGAEGQQMYNATHNVMQFCDDTNWVSMAATGDGDTLADLSCTDGQVAKWNNTGSVWECAADDAGSTSFSSLAVGSGSTAPGTGSLAVGNTALASGANSLAVGTYSNADGNQSVAMGGYTIAYGDNSVAMGQEITATGANTMAFGLSAQSSNVSDWPQTTGAGSVGFFMDRFDNYNLSATDTFGIIGGEIMLDDDGTSAATKGCIRFDDTAGALQYSNDCSTYSSFGGNDNLGNHTATTDLNIGANNVLLGTSNLQSLSGNDAEALLYKSNSSTQTSLIFQDKEGTGYGQIFGTGDGVNFGLLDGDGDYGILMSKDFNTQFHINGTEEMRITPTAINMQTNDITNAGNVTATAYFHSSDERLKDNIETMSGLDLIMQLRGVSYDWKKDGTASAGVIAQDVEKVLPSAVKTGEDGMKSVEYDQLIAPLIEAVKELKAENDNLKKRVQQLESQK